MLCCYHHTDLDGNAAAYIVHKFAPEGVEQSANSFHPTDYDQKNKFSAHSTNMVQKDDIVIVDVSLGEADWPLLIKMCDCARTVTWIDHHKSSLDLIEKHKVELQKIPNLTYFVVNGICGAALAYCYFNISQKYLRDIIKDRVIEENDYSITAKSEGFGHVSVTCLNVSKKDPTDYMVYTEEINLPQWLAHVDDYDCWKKLQKSTDHFVLGVQSRNINFTIPSGDGKTYNTQWEYFTDKYETQRFIQEGLVIDNYIKSRYDHEMDSTFEWKYKGTTFLCKNAQGNSWNFGSKIYNYDAVILFNYEGSVGKWVYSVYCHDKSKFDCAEFAKTFPGGGGHKGAAGFSTDALIFTDKKYYENAKHEPPVMVYIPDDDEAKVKQIKEYMRLFTTKAVDLTFKYHSEELKDEEKDVKNDDKLYLVVSTAASNRDHAINRAADLARIDKKVMLAIVGEKPDYLKEEEAEDILYPVTLAPVSFDKRMDKNSMSVEDAEMFERILPKFFSFTKAETNM